MSEPTALHSTTYRHTEISCLKKLIKITFGDTSATDAADCRTNGTAALEQHSFDDYAMVSRRWVD